jgi:hypothetical protein
MIDHAPFRLICLNETKTTVGTGRHLSDAFTIQNDEKTGD